MLAGTAALTGCSASEHGFASRANAACAKAQHQVEELSIHGDTSGPSIQAALRKAVDQYTIVERLISEISEGSLPGGADGAAVRRDWIDPARASLTTRLSDLDALSKAVDARQADAVPALASAAALAGTDGVDTGYLADHSMPSCASLFAS